LTLAVAIAASYLAGSIPFGLFIARLAAGKDVLEIGSGNIGATNVARAAGRTAAVSTLLLDALKGFLPAFVASKSADSWGSACGVAAVVGHCFPVWLRFRGGKGVATGLGVTLALAPIAALAGAGVWTIGFGLTRIASVGSLAGSLAALLVAYATVSRAALVAVAAICGLVAVRHRSNVRRLLNGEER